MALEWLRAWLVRLFEVRPSFEDRRNQLIEQARSRAKAEGRLYDAYPEYEEEPELWITVHGRDAYGRIRSRKVDLDGLSLHQLNPKPHARRGATTVAEWVWGQIIDTWVPLAVTINETRRAKRG